MGEVEKCGVGALDGSRFINACGIPGASRDGSERPAIPATIKADKGEASPEKLPSLSTDTVKVSKKGNSGPAAPTLSEVAAKAKEAEAASPPPPPVPPDWSLPPEPPAPATTPAQAALQHARALSVQEGQRLDSEEWPYVESLDAVERARVAAKTVGDALAAGSAAGTLAKAYWAKSHRWYQPCVDVVRKAFGGATKLSASVPDALRVVDAIDAAGLPPEISRYNKELALLKAIRLGRTKDEAVRVAEKAKLWQDNKAFDVQMAAYTRAAELCETISQAIALANHRDEHGSHGNLWANHAYRRALDLARSRSEVDAILDDAARNPRVNKETYVKLERLSKPFYQRRLG